MLFLFSGLMPLPSLAGTIEGRVFTESGALKDAKVYVFKDYKDLQEGSFYLISGATDQEGLYKFDLPEGEYYFVAKGSLGDKDFFSYHGGNPISIGNQKMWLPLIANEVKMPVISDAAGSLKGTITFKGEPVKDVHISLYEPGDKSFKGLGFRTERIENGVFNLAVPPNKYVVIARKMEGDHMMRPLKSGDLYCYYPQNPVEVKPGKIIHMELPCSLKGEKTTKGNSYQTVDELRESFRFGIKGKITDRDAKPVQGIYIIAFKGDPSNNFASYRNVQDKANISRTDKNGEYFIPLDSDGFYRIVARNKLGARTGENEFFMLYSGNVRHGFDFKEGQVIDNVNMVIEKTGDVDIGGSK